eukprot:TRINITY_DN8126_c0_g4_i1.p2 TRINITY_DN8126_c0_g4~~TRINITY_DN8126_c0_g4_i1.p2  ORF type:complete len:142 (-),score=22.80 TRINITY_DN8126_c0_g4_i1:243-668(-)
MWSWHANRTPRPFLRVDSGQTRSFKMRTFNQDEPARKNKAGSVLSNTPQSCGKLCACAFSNERACAVEPIKVVHLHLNFKEFDHSVQLCACDSTCKRDVRAGMESKECEHLEISVKRTFIDVEVKMPKVMRSTSSPSVLVM